MNGVLAAFSFINPLSGQAGTKRKRNHGFLRQKNPCNPWFIALLFLHRSDSLNTEEATPWLIHSFTIYPNSASIADQKLKLEMLPVAAP
jgi:hypothetical protein